MSGRNQIWIGCVLALISLTTLVGVQHWMNTRSFVALDMPISLALGHTKTAPFHINLENYYELEIKTGWESYYDPDCSPSDRARARWRLHKDGDVVVDWLDSPNPYPYLGNFFGRKGTYELELEILSDASCLNPGHPRLLVYTNTGEYEDGAAPILWASALGVAVGLSLVGLGFLTFSAPSTPHNTRVTDSPSIGQSFQWAQKLPLKREFSSPPAFALLAAPCLIFVIFIMMILVAPYPQKGIYVHLLKPGHTAEDNDPLIEPIVVRIVEPDPGIPPRLTITSQATTWNKLAGDLRDQLKLRPKWVVYVATDPDVAWGDTVRVIDVAKGLQASVVLLTPATSHKAPPSPAAPRRTR